MEIKIVGTPEELAAFARKAFDGKAPNGDDNKFKEMVNQFLTMYGTSLKPKEWPETGFSKTGSCSCLRGDDTT